MDEYRWKPMMPGYGNGYGYKHGYGDRAHGITIFNFLDRDTEMAVGYAKLVP